MAVIPARGFNFNEGGLQTGPSYRLLGPLAPGCVWLRSHVVIRCAGAGNVVVSWAYALGPSDQANSGSFEQGYIPFTGPSGATAISGREAFSANVSPDTGQEFWQFFGRRVLTGPEFIIVAVAADVADRGSIWIGFEVVGVQADPGVPPGRVARSG